VAVLAVLALFVLLTQGLYTGQHREVLGPYFHPTEEVDSFVTPQELTALRTLAARVPAGAVVAENPWNGGSYMYLVSGRRMLFPSEKSMRPGDPQLLARRLDDAGSDPAVCRAAQSQRVRFALTGGTPATKGRSPLQYRGIDAVGSSPAFRQVAEAAPYRLYELVGCASS
jgi:hypothetical protein